MAETLTEPAPPRRTSGSEKRQRAWRYNVRCSEEEFAAIAAAAERAGMTVSAFIRHQATGKAGPRAARRPTVDRVELAKVLAQLGKWGSNVNQLARAYNTDGATPTATELAEIRAAVTAMRETLMEALGHTP